MRLQRLTGLEIEKLRAEYGWEIGTHAYHHLDAVNYSMAKGLDTWVNQELKASIEDFTARGFNIQSLAFPFNNHTPALIREAGKLLQSYRRRDKLGMFKNFGDDGSFPAASIDLAHYTPVNILLQRIDLAVESQQSISFYAHRVLPDDAFALLVVEEVAGSQVRFTAAPELDTSEALILIPNPNKAVQRPAPFSIVRLSGPAASLNEQEMGKHLRPGATVLVGPAYSTRLSDFRAVLNHARNKLEITSVSRAQETSTKRSEAQIQTR